MLAIFPIFKTIALEDYVPKLTNIPLLRLIKLNLFPCINTNKISHQGPKKPKQTATEDTATPDINNNPLPL